ncbi:hypothetical protein BO94DRAFT_584500 [Aspergillus sclerotioniger CBS 115572]|uniref:Uncharacterized protein n=1 Tax=Aspergillus sclerotioniger CBS 115572 TaxID=1450535 RepID=A0A317WWT2_9EURO|nr:hypothetical protein BO94DRAFT_584500 [Aspergillus sclerotioniger CBS 115572]PWY90495.1 hypothetical protein BO94DRAFT_584500 [Aspergillus sclerotioniger CBS 115572]
MDHKIVGRRPVWRERDCPRNYPNEPSILSARNFDLIASSPTLFCLPSILLSHHPITLFSSPYILPDPPAQATLVLQSILPPAPSVPPIRAADKRTSPTSIPELPHQALLQPPSKTPVIHGPPDSGGPGLLVIRQRSTIALPNP